MSQNISRADILSRVKPWRFALLERLRREKGLTQKEVAAAAGHDVGWYQAIQKWEGEVSWTDVLAMAAKVGMNLDSLRRQLCKAPAVSAEEVERDRSRLRDHRERVEARKEARKRAGE